METTAGKLNTGFPSLIIFLIIFGTIGLGLWFVMGNSDDINKSIVVTEWAELTSVQIETVNKQGNHAYVRHGVESSLALKCLQENGSKQSFDTFPDEDSAFKSVTFLCNFPKQPNTDYAIVLRKMSDGSWQLITAYKVSREIFPKLSNYVGYLYEYWNATVSTTVIKAGEIIYNFPIK